jgi:hypothetical protein
MITKQHIDFLHWLKNRISYKYNDRDNSIVKNIDEIISVVEPKPFVINKNKIMKICKRLYPTFDFEKDENSLFDVGYSKKEKIEILNHVTSIINEYYKS